MYVLAVACQRWCEHLVWTSAWARRNSITCSSRQKDWRGSTTVMGKCLTHECRVSKALRRSTWWFYVPQFLLFCSDCIKELFFGEHYSTGEGSCYSTINKRKGDKNTQFSKVWAEILYEKVNYKAYEGKKKNIPLNTTLSLLLLSADKDATLLLAVMESEIRTVLAVLIDDEFDFESLI